MLDIASIELDQTAGSYSNLYHILGLLEMPANGLSTPARPVLGIYTFVSAPTAYWGE